jgi:hypothetical protein
LVLVIPWWRGLRPYRIWLAVVAGGRLMATAGVTRADRQTFAISVKCWTTGGPARNGPRAAT